MSPSALSMTGRRRTRRTELTSEGSEHPESRVVQLVDDDEVHAVARPSADQWYGTPTTASS